MNKIPCAFQNTEAKTLPADVIVFGHFGRLSPAAVYTTDCRFDSGVKWWIHVSSIVICLLKNSFLLHWNNCKQCTELSTCCCFWSTASKRSIDFEHSFLIDECSCKIVTAFWYLQLLCNLTQLQFTIGQNEFFFVCVFPGQLPNLGDLSVHYHLCLYDSV